LWKTLGLLLALVIIGVASLVAFAHYQQLLSLQKTLNTGQTTALPTIFVPPGFTRYQNPQLGVSLNYPLGWHSAPGTTITTAPYSSERFSTGKFAWLEVGFSTEYASLVPDQINNRIIAALRAAPTVSSVDTTSPISPITHIDGQDWTTEYAFLFMQDGTILQATTLALVHNGRGYVIFYQCFQGDYDLFSHQFFAPMLLSFRFLSS
jgi:hypothetical protein